MSILKNLPKLRLLLLAALFNPLHASDWADKYLHRPLDQLDLPEKIDGFASPTRQTINLNGEWQARENDDETWRSVIVPGAYEFDGKLEFKKTFSLDSSYVGKAFKLVAFGVNNRSTFFINGEFIGSHVGGHTSFSLEIDAKNLKIGQSNEIQVRVDNTPRPTTSIPLKHSPRIPTNYGGIFRDIFILAVPNVYFDDLTLNKTFSDDFSTSQLQVETKLRNKRGLIPADSLRFQVRMQLWDDVDNRRPRGAQVIDIGLDDHVLSLKSAMDVSNFELWTTDNPKLYELRMLLVLGPVVVDEYRVRIGFNKIEISGSKLLLNGTASPLKGVDLVEDFSSSGPAVGWRAIRDQVMEIKEIGINAIRVLGFPPHPFMLEICDEVGMLLIEEVPLVLVPDARFREKSFVELTTNYVKEMVARDAHHPSLTAWGLGSDLQLAENSTATYLKNAIEIIRSRSDRPTYVISRNIEPSSQVAGVDFVLVEGFGKEPDDLVPMLEQYATRSTGNPLMCSYGYSYLLDESPSLLDVDPKSNGQSRSNRLNQLQVRYQELQAHKLREAVLNDDLSSKLAGMFVHTIVDWKEAKPHLSAGRADDPMIRRSGLIHLNGERRFAYEVLTSELKRNQHIQIPVHDQAEDYPIAFPVIGVLIIFVFLYNFNRSRSLRGNVRRIFVYPHGFYTELKDKRKISVFHTFLLGLVACTIFGVLVASTAYHLRQNPIFNEFLSLVIGSNLIKSQVIRLIWHPVICLIFVSTLAFMVYGSIILFMKVAGWTLDRNLPLVQFFTLVFWASANFVWLLPIAPIYYRIVNQTTWAGVAIVLVGVFSMWFAARLFRGSRVIFGSALPRALLLFGILCVTGLAVVGLYYESSYALFDYLPIYFNFATARYF
jgi:hypothetical protein